MVRTRFLSKFSDNTRCASAGKMAMPSTKEAPRANVFVNASGLNNFPSADSMANTGKKLTTVVASAVVIADDTSTVAW